MKINIFSQGEEFRVPKGSLGFSVVVYSVCAIIALSLLVVRRNIKSIGGELGGPKFSKTLSAVVFLLLWVTYVMLSIANSKGWISVEF